MRKFGGNSKIESLKSFCKIQSESQMVDESVKLQKNVQFHLYGFAKDSSNVVKSIPIKSLQNIPKTSLAPRMRSVQRRSLGGQIDADYIVDTET